MWTALFSAVATLLVGLAKAWLSQQSVTGEAEKVGVSQQALSTESQANAKIVDAAKARDAVVPLTVAELSAHNATNDPDFRD